MRRAFETTTVMASHAPLCPKFDRTPQRFHTIMTALSELLSQVPGLAWLLLGTLLFAALQKIFNII